MKVPTLKYARISRILLLIAVTLTIPFLLITTIFEKAGGGRQRMQYLLYPIMCFLVCFVYILYKRRLDKEKKLKSKTILIVSELIISVTSLIIAFFTIYAMITWDFIPQVLFIALGLIYISLSLLFDCLNDLRAKNNC